MEEVGVGWPGRKRRRRWKLEIKTRTSGWKRWKGKGQENKEKRKGEKIALGGYWILFQRSWSPDSRNGFTEYRPDTLIPRGGGRSKGKEKMRTREGGWRAKGQEKVKQTRKQVGGTKWRKSIRKNKELRTKGEDRVRGNQIKDINRFLWRNKKTRKKMQKVQNERKENEEWRTKVEDSDERKRRNEGILGGVTVGN